MFYSSVVSSVYVGIHTIQKTALYPKYLSSLLCWSVEMVAERANHSSQTQVFMYR